MRKAEKNSCVIKCGPINQDSPAMDSKEYLKLYGWKEGEALKTGGLKKPILVKYKKDKKGLGSAPGQDDSEAWWERLFDGHLKGLEISANDKKSGISFKQNKVVASAVSKESSPLYRSFVRGESLQGTIKDPKKEDLKQLIVLKSRKRSREAGNDGKHLKRSKQDRKDKKRKRQDEENGRENRKEKKQKKKKEKKEKKDTKHRKDKKDKKDKKEKRQMKQKKEKKDKKDKKDKEEKKEGTSKSSTM